MLNRFLNWLVSRIRGDVHIWIVVLFLTLFSVLVVYSSTGSLAYLKKSGNTEYYLFRQLMFIAVGLVLMYLIHRINYIYFLRISQLLLYISIPMLILTYLLGPSINEARRWLVLPGTGFTFQTSDLAKLAIIMYLARGLSKKQDEVKNFKTTFLPLAGAIVVICLLIAPSDLSTAVVILISSVLMLFIGRSKISHILGFLAVLIVAGSLSILIAFQLGAPGRVATWKSRIESYFNEEEESYQAQQAKIAIAKGELLGQGPGHSRQKNFLPNPYSDFIYAIIIEEYGLIGGIFIIFLYLYLLFRTVRIVLKSDKTFGALLAVGLSIMLVLQAFINMAVATNLLPVTGLTLPLISMGGTSVLISSISLGIILSVSRYIEENEKNNTAGVTA